MTKTVTSPYDVPEHLRTPEEVAVYLEASIEGADGDAGFTTSVLDDIASAKGMSQVARDAGLSRESLYKALSGERNPTLDTVLRVVGALGLKLRAETVVDSADSKPESSTCVRCLTRRSREHLGWCGSRTLTRPRNSPSSSWC